MNILYLPGYRYPASLEEPITCGDLRYSFNLSRAIAKLGINVNVISRKNSTDRYNACLDQVNIFRYKSEFSKLFPTSFDISFNRNKIFRKLLKKADALILNSPLSLELINFNFKGPVIYICSGLEDTKNYKLTLNEIFSLIGIKLLRDPAKKLSWRLSDKIVTTAYAEDKTLLKLGVNKNKILRISSGVEIDRYSVCHKSKQGLKVKLNLSDHKIVLSVSRFTPAKGIIETIKAFELLKRRMNKKIKLLLIGVRHSHNKEYFKDIRESIKRLQLKDDVLLIENVPERNLPLYYSIADVFSVFSKGYDPLPTSIIEAMSCKTPVVSTYYKTREQFINHNETGLFVKELNIEQWANTVMKLFENKKLNDRITSKAFKYVKKNFGMNSIALKYIKLLKDKNE